MTTPRPSARAARSPTPVPAPSAARSPPCGDENPRSDSRSESRRRSPGDSPMSAPVATRRRGRSALRALSTALIVSGLLLLADAGATLLWQEPVSALYASRQQGELANQLEQLDTV